MTNAMTANTTIAAEFAHDQAPEAAEQIAREHLGMRTLETQNSDRADFKEHAVWAIKKALEAAYAAGVETALQAAEQAAEHAAEASAEKAKRAAKNFGTPPTPDTWLVMESGRDTGAMAAFDTYAEAAEEAEERAEKNRANGTTDTAVWVQPAFAFHPWA